MFRAAIERAFWGARIALLGCFLGALGCANQPSELPRPSRLVLLVETPLGRPVPAATFQVNGSRLTTDAEGRAEAVVSAQGASLFARCPAGFGGASWERQLSPNLFKAAHLFEFRLVCSPHEKNLAVAVLSEQCQEIEVLLDGELLGSSENGLLHRLVRAPSQKSVELTARSLQDGCRLRQPRRVVYLDALAAAVWVRFQGAKTGRTSVVAKKRAAPSPADRPLPYRL